jgi:putative ABC transport system permease protein
MNIDMLIFIALQALWRNKSRSLLTMLGVIIGVGSVIMLTAIGSGLQRMIAQQFAEFGVNNLYVFPGDIFGESGFQGEEMQLAMANNKLRLEHVQAIRRIRTGVKAVTGMAAIPSEISYRTNTKKTTITGVDSEYALVTNTEPEIGRFFTQTEVNRKDKVVVLGSKLAKELFGYTDPINKKVRIHRQTFTVIGVAKEKGVGFGSQTIDAFAITPITTWMKLFDNNQVMEMHVTAESAESIPAVKTAIRTELLRTLNQKDFTVSEQSEILGVINQILAALTAGLGGIAAISLLVGGIGIMNIMLVSVTERTKEIGLRKALGATPNTILSQFVIEAVVLSVTGGVIGVMLAFVGTLAINAFIPAAITLQAILLAFTVSASVGIIFGVYPARKASKLSPIEALRYE